MSEKEKMTQHFPLVVPGDHGIRPAGKPDECFYCSQRIGVPHKPDCVMVTKRVRVRYSFDIEIDVPHHWGCKRRRVSSQRGLLVRRQRNHRAEQDV